LVLIHGDDGEDDDEGDTSSLKGAAYTAKMSAMNAGFAYEEQIGTEGRGQSVLAHLAHRYRHSSEDTWRVRIAAGEVRVGDRPAMAAQVLRAGDRLVWHRPPWEEPPVPLAFAVLYRDEHLLAVAKPRGLPSVPNGGFLEHTLLHIVRRLDPSATPLHRLGRGTSGLLLFARTDTARRKASAAWRDNAVEKEYRALVQGTPTREAFSIDVPIGPVPHPRLGDVHAASPKGRAALSHVRCLAHTPQGNTVVAVQIASGRPHQIRIHLAAAGHPLVGDPLYVAGGRLADDPGLPGDAGYLLHSHRIVLSHPATDRRLELTCAPPPALRGELHYDPHRGGHEQ
jgi:23S rRNA pseudouridine1911/1915/1917 synthase